MHRPLPDGLRGMFGGLGNLPFELPGPQWPQLAQPAPATPGSYDLPDTPYAPTPYAPTPYEPTAYPPLDEIGLPVVLPEGEGPLQCSLELTGSNTVVRATPGLRFYGFSARETAATPAAATATIRLGLAGGPARAFINLAASEGIGEVFPKGIDSAEGLYFQLQTGSMSCVVYYKTGSA